MLRIVERNRLFGDKFSSDEEVIADIERMEAEEKAEFEDEKAARDVHKRWTPGKGRKIIFK